MTTKLKFSFFATILLLSLVGCAGYGTPAARGGYPLTASPAPAPSITALPGVVQAQSTLTYDEQLALSRLRQTESANEAIAAMADEHRIGMQATAACEQATSTAAAISTEAAGTRTQDAHLLNLQLTKDVATAESYATATAAPKTATAEALMQVESEHMKTQTAKAEASKVEAERNSSGAASSFWWVLIIVVIGLAITAVLLGGIWVLAEISARQAKHTRIIKVGKLIVSVAPSMGLGAPPSVAQITGPDIVDGEFTDNDGYSDDDEPDEPGTEVAETAIPYNAGKGKTGTVMPRDKDGNIMVDPELWKARGICRRLLIEAMQYKEKMSEKLQRGHPMLDPRRIPSHTKLAWQAGTWDKAIKLLEPHVETQVGRGGGTWCSDDYDNLKELLDAIISRQVWPNLDNWKAAQARAGEVQPTAG